MSSQDPQRPTPGSPAATSRAPHRSSGGGHQVSPRPGDAVALMTEHGRTSIADTVVTKIAGLAAREVWGVHQLGGGAARAVGAIRERIPGATSSAAQGVAVEVGERQAAVDLDVMVEYGVAIADVAAAIRRNVISSIERMTGLEVTEVNITIDDLHLPDDRGDANDAEADGRGFRVE